MVVLEGRVVSHERGVPAGSNRGASHRSIGLGMYLHESAVDPGYSSNPFSQGYLAHTDPPLIGPYIGLYPGSYVGPKGGRQFLMSEVPLYKGIS